jgi:hypothetical protein
MIDLNSLVFELLEHGMDDWCSDGEVASIVLERFSDIEYRELTEIVMKLVRTVLENNWMQAGTYTDAKGFSAWSLDAVGAIGKINCLWDELGRKPHFGELFMLDITPAGEEVYRLWRQQKKQ